MKTEYARIVAFITKDGSAASGILPFAALARPCASEIRELMHPAAHAVRHQSLAEAIVAPGQTTALHRHDRSEELYHVTAGCGLMTLGSTRFEVGVGDTVCIPPGTPHCIENTGSAPLRILCCCAPPYAHDDTELL